MSQGQDLERFALHGTCRNENVQGRRESFPSLFLLALQLPLDPLRRSQSFLRPSESQFDSAGRRFLSFLSLAARSPRLLQLHGIGIAS